jgi:hypothetical protein
MDIRVFELLIMPILKGQWCEFILDRCFDQTSLALKGSVVWFYFRMRCLHQTSLALKGSVVWIYFRLRCFHQTGLALKGSVVWTYLRQSCFHQTSLAKKKHNTVSSVLFCAMGEFAQINPHGTSMFNLSTRTWRIRLLYLESVCGYQYSDTAPLENKRSHPFAK